MKTALLNQANRLLTGAGVKLMRHHSLYDWQITLDAGLSATRRDEGPEPNQRLADLERRYGTFDAQVTTPFQWIEGTVTKHHLRNFRDDNPYVWQKVNLNTNDIAYALSYYHLKPKLRGMTEDGAFGARTIELDGQLVSRDLLDSAGEIDFLTRHLGNKFSILDIGAGYGRLAHRLSQATEAQIYATDAFAASTFLSEYYLEYRNARAKVIALDEVEEFLATHQLDIATNIHSFSECHVEAIEWWVSRLKSHYLMVVPNTGLQRCLTNDGKDMEEVFARHGYLPVAREPRHADPLIQKYGVDPSWFHLFKRSRP